MASSLVLTFACGGNDDGADNMTPDAGADPGSPDAGDQEPDASIGGGATALGQECEATPEDSCPDGHNCLPLGGATHPWCSVQCEAPPTSPDEVENGCEGYEGPGIASCLLGISTDGDQMPDFYACAIVCEDSTGNYCQEGDDCDGTCPHGLSCNPTGQGISTCG